MLPGGVPVRELGMGEASKAPTFDRATIFQTPGTGKDALTAGVRSKSVSGSPAEAGLACLRSCRPASAQAIARPAATASGAAPGELGPAGLVLTR